jgi:integrase
VSIRKHPIGPKDTRKGYEVMWREGGRQRSRMFDRKGDAEAFELDIKRRAQLGPLASTVMVSRMTLAEFMQDEWWPRYAVPNLKASTQRRYLEVWGAYLLPTLGSYQLRQIDTLLVEDLRTQLTTRGLGAASIVKAMNLLSGILKRAVVRQLIPANPVTMVDKPKVPAPAEPKPLSPASVERIRGRLRPRDAALVSLLAYGGLRPGEVMRARWGQLAERTLHVPPQKTSKARHVKLLSPLARDLAEWRLASGRPGDRELIFPCEQIAQSRRRASIEWQRHDWQNWVQRIYQPAAEACGVSDDMRAYRLRGSFVSLLLWEGQSLTGVAKQAGHSVATLARHYAGVIEELEEQPRVPAAEAIRRAREEATGQLRLVSP